MIWLVAGCLALGAFDFAAVMFLVYQLGKTRGVLDAARQARQTGGEGAE